MISWCWPQSGSVIKVFGFFTRPMSLPGITKQALVCQSLLGHREACPNFPVIAVVLQSMPPFTSLALYSQSMPWFAIHYQVIIKHVSRFLINQDVSKSVLGFGNGMQSLMFAADSCNSQSLGQYDKYWGLKAHLQHINFGVSMLHRQKNFSHKIVVCQCKKE